MEPPSACVRRPCPFGTPCDDAHVDRLLAHAPVPAFVVCLVDGTTVWRNERAAAAGFRPRAALEDCAEGGETARFGEVVRRLREAPSADALRAAARSPVSGRCVDVSLHVIDDARPPRQALAFALSDRDEDPSRLDELDQLLRSITRQLAFAGYQFGSTRPLADIEGVELLNDRERETLALIVSGVDVAGVAARLFVSQSTVRNYLSAIYAKLGVGNRSELLALVLGGGGTGGSAGSPGVDDVADEDDHARRRRA